MASFWPMADQNPSAPEPIVEFARMWRNMPKIVFSKTLQHVEHNSRLAGSDLETEVAKLKEEVHGDLGVCGATLAGSFMTLHLIDEFRLFVRPIVLGGGKPYFPPLDRAVNLRLAETRTFPRGVVLLRYEREPVHATSSTRAGSP
jgi:dihydrofolate reductase